MAAFAVASDKDYGEMIRILCTIPDLKGVTVTEIENYRRTDLETVASIFKKNWHGYVGHSYNINEAIITSEQQAAKVSECCTYLCGIAVSGRQCDRSTAAVDGASTGRDGAGRTDR